MYCEQVGLPSESKTAVMASDKALIVVPCLNEGAHIESLLTELCRDTADLDRLIAIVDGGSSDGTLSIAAELAAREQCLRVVSNPKRIQSAAVNLAVNAFGAGHRWLVRLDAHARYPQGYVRKLIAEAHRTDAASVVVAMRSEGGEGFQRAVALVQNSLLGAGGAPHRRSGKEGFADHGHHALFDLSRFVAVGGYDEGLSHNEDAEFDIRLGRAGGRIWLTRAVEVVYFPRATVRSLFRQYLSYGRGRAATLLRHRKIPRLRQVLPACVAPACAGLLCTPWLAVAGLPALCWSAVCVLLGARLGLRFGTRCAVSVAIAAMTIHMAWSIGFWSELLGCLRRGEGRAMKAALTAGDVR